ncbi:capsule biosynthesis protein [Sulfitobacter litoralis]|uniref:capsule biosynthesis protein n=1 Tax=Sulfitobacter litoralis TaxID=335975 RepID=UPI002B27775A|nr:capsule biosynthesis protein [Sulfitobacter litoralis]
MNQSIAQAAANLQSHAGRKERKRQEREEALARIEKQRRRKVRAIRAQENSADAAAQPNVLPLPPPPIAAPVPNARLQLRHRLAFVSFVLSVLGSSLLASWYLWERAADRYTSVSGFSVHTEDMSSAIELLGGVANLSGSGAEYEEMLYQFIKSQELVSRIDKTLNLRHLWSTYSTEMDPIFGYHSPGTIEDLTKYWGRMVSVYSDSSSGLISLKVQAFTPEDAQAIATEIVQESSNLIHELSAIAREDSTKHAEESLRLAAQRLKLTRRALSDFRINNQIVSPDSPLQIQTGLLSSLEAEMTETLISLDMLNQTTNNTDPRVRHAERRRQVIADRISQEREKLNYGQSAQRPAGFAKLFGQFESLKVDLEFSEQAYLAARASYDAAVAEARRKSKYLAAHIPPTLSETAALPNRPFLLGMTFITSFTLWTIVMMIVYSLRDRR